MSWCFKIGLCVFTSAFITVAKADEKARYVVAPSDDGDIITVNFTLSGRYALRALSQKAPELLDSDSLEDWQLSDDRLVSKSQKSGTYTADTGGGWVNRFVEFAFVLGDVRITDFRDWLWLPELSRDEWVTVTVLNKVGQMIAVPWLLVSKQDNIFTYRLEPSMLNQPGLALFGPFRHASIMVRSASIQIYALAPTQGKSDRYISWIENTVGVLANTFSQVPSGAVWVVPTWYGDPAVSHAVVKRAGANGIYVMPRDDAKPEEWLQDWTLYHEFAHWMHPYLGQSGRWLAEGLASYYQYILMVRGGQLSPEHGWRRLVTGLNRGRDKGGNMDTYWRGAAFALILDVRLRKSSVNTLTLAKLLSLFGECCIPTHKPWRAEDFIRRLDELGGDGIVLEEYDASLGPDFPPFEKVLKEIGINPEDGSFVARVDDHLRDQIMRLVN